MGLQPFCGTGPHRLLLVGLWAACGKITVSGIPNCLSYYVLFMVYTQYTHVVVHCAVQAGGPRVGDLCCSSILLFGLTVLSSWLILSFIYSFFLSLLLCLPETSGSFKSYFVSIISTHYAFIFKYVKYRLAWSANFEHFFFVWLWFLLLSLVKYHEEETDQLRAELSVRSW
jgi:hypothetical protein